MKPFVFVCLFVYSEHSNASQGDLHEGHTKPSTMALKQQAGDCLFYY
jgi:hypothetical protein